MRTSRTENSASALASRTSHAVMRSTPPPTHQPCTAATIGVRQSATAVIDACRSRRWCRNSSRAPAVGSVSTLPSDDVAARRSSP